ncbi:PREDICTED: probable polyol transporter 6 [Camelina sativa]|uniref:Probable polyol transporter 6 n=1 Tax=Camelina sativa TaxID=90675 RepID=A0ABM0UV12_CAMSA|nr:PREDICTED: probable polyol transporter 6 [Camelina sativa]
MADQITGEKPVGVNRFALQCAIVASIVSIIFGYDTGVMSGAMVFIEEDLKTNEVQIEVLTGILNLCALVGSLLAGRTSDIIGRRYTIVLASILFMLGSILMGWGPNYPVLLTGRCTAGLGVGFALMVAPVYSAEIATASHRGLLASLPHLCISIGILTGYLVNYFFSKLPMHIGWRLMLGIAAVPSLVLALGILKMPESPRWLILQGRLKEGRDILELVSNSSEEAEIRFQDIKTAAGIDPKCKDDVVKMENKKTHGEGVWKELILRPTPAVRRVLLTALGIHFFQHATGIEAVLLYGPKIFKKAGITAKDKLFLVTIGVGIMKTTFIFTATFLLDKVGRRKLLLTSVGGMVIALTTLGFGLTMAQNSGGKLAWALVLSIVAAYSFVAVFSIGLGPITWVYSSEVFPLKLRAQGASLGVAVNRIMNATVSMSFLSLSRAITTGGAFFMFAGVAAVAWNFFFFLMPETKGKSLEEIEALFQRDGDKVRGENNSFISEIEMKEDDALPTTTANSGTATGTAMANSKKENSDSILFGRGRYKFWAFGAILLLAFWSMFTGTVTLRLTTGNLNRFSEDLGIPNYDNLDVLEMEEREKVVKHMWDAYTSSRRIKLPRFWQEAFVAAYEELTSDVPGVRDAAIGEIAKMSVQSITIDPPPSRSMIARDLGRNLKRILHKPATSS